MRAGGLLVGCLLVVGCAPEHCVPGDYTREWACPSEEMVEQQVVMTDAFEQFFFALSDAEASCVAEYWYREPADIEAVQDICGSGTDGCFGRGDERSGRYIVAHAADPDWAPLAQRQRHEALHLILYCTGEDPGHHHPAFMGNLPEYPDGSHL